MEDAFTTFDGFGHHVLLFPPKLFFVVFLLFLPFLDAGDILSFVQDTADQFVVIILLIVSPEGAHLLQPVIRGLDSKCIQVTLIEDVFPLLLLMFAVKMLTRQ